MAPQKPKTNYELKLRPTAWQRMLNLGIVSSVKKPPGYRMVGSKNWVMVSNNFWNFHPYLGKIPILINIFQRGWFNHQVEKHPPPRKIVCLPSSLKISFLKSWGICWGWKFPYFDLGSHSKINVSLIRLSKLPKCWQRPDEVFGGWSLEKWWCARFICAQVYMNSHYFQCNRGFWKINLIS